VAPFPSTVAFTPLRCEADTFRAVYIRAQLVLRPSSLGTWAQFFSFSSKGESVLSNDYESNNESSIIGSDNYMDEIIDLLILRFLPSST